MRYNIIFYELVKTKVEDINGYFNFIIFSKKNAGANMDI